MAKKKVKAGGSKKKTPKKTTTPPGIGLERTVARIQQLMDPQSVVTHNEKLVDRYGNTRQFDVVIRGHFGGQAILGVIECKDHGRPKGPDAVEAFAKKAENVGANFKIMVSRRGFTQQALTLAEKEFVGCRSLLPRDPKQLGWSIGSFWYAPIRRWTDVRLIVDFATDVPPITNYRSDSIIWDGLPVSRWFLRYLFTNRDDNREPGVYRFGLEFDQVRVLTVEDREYPVKGLSCEARWVKINKRKWVSWSGDAFYDWHKQALAIPNKVTLAGSFVEIDALLWDDYDGEIPTLEELKKQPWMTAMFFDDQKIPEGMEIPELQGL